MNNEELDLEELKDIKINIEDLDKETLDVIMEELSNFIDKLSK